jgi:DNA recombination protein RmuC
VAAPTMSEAQATLTDMEIVVTLIVGLLVGAALGGLIGWLLGARAHSARATGEDPAVIELRHGAAIAQLRAEEAGLRAALEREHLELRSAEAARSSETHARLQSQISGLGAQVEGLLREVDAHQERFQDLMERHQREQAAQKAREGDESKVLQALSPVQATLQDMKSKVAELEMQRAEQYSALGEQLSQARVSNEQVRATAESLAAVMRNNSMRGAWGEAQLRNIVEAAGLTSRVDFDLQATSRSEDGVRRPDMVVRLPEGKAIAVDSKVPLSAFIEASEIPVTATGAEAARRESLMRDHVRAVRAHIDALSAKGYWNGLSASPEFVIAFMPSESLLSAALAADPSLLDYSFTKKVALASPVNLWAVLKTVAYTWNQELLTEDAKQLFELSKTLYERLSVLAQHADKLRGAIERTVTTYNEFAGSLETRVLVTARKISRMDETKIIGEAGLVETAPRSLTAPELTAQQIDGTDDVEADRVRVARELDAVAPHQPELIDFTAEPTSVAQAAADDDARTA